MVASAEGSDKTVKVWETATGKEIATFQHESWTMGIAFSPDGKTIAAAIVNHVKLWDLATRKEVATFKCPAYRVAFAPDGKVLACAAETDGADQREKIVRLWDVTAGKQIAALEAVREKERMLRSVVFFPDGTLVTVADDAVRIWKAEAAR
jgi:WD40 repeat protein